MEWFAPIFLRNVFIFLACYAFNEALDYAFPPRNWRLNVIISLLAAMLGNILGAGSP